jgi:TPR repeat protein
MRKFPWVVLAVSVAAAIAASLSCAGQAGRANPPRPAATAAPSGPADAGRPDSPRPVVATAPAQCASRAECRKSGQRLASGGAAEKAQAAEYFSLGCQKNDGESCASLAEILKDGQGAAKDVKRAFDAYKRACDLRQLGACRAVGSYYLSGSPGVVDQNPAKAAKIFDRACKAGHAGSCFDLATLYEEGKGVKRNPKKAARLRIKGEVFEGVE